MRGDLWSNERVAALKLWWGEGDSARAIAERLGGVSRSAVLGKIFRLRLAAAAASAPIAAPPQREPGRPRRRGKSLLALKNDSCRWPFGRPGTKSFFFCGEPGADLERGMPYCARHARRAYRGTMSIATAATAARSSAVSANQGDQKFHGRSVAR